MAKSSAAAERRDDEDPAEQPAAPEQRIRVRVFSGDRATELPGDGVDVHDEAGRLLVRFRDGAAVIAAPSGDLTLEAPMGRVVLRSGIDVVMSAARDVTHHAGRAFEVSAGEEGDKPQLSVHPRATAVRGERLEVEVKQSRLVTGEATVVARRIVTTAEQIAESVGRLEIRAKKLIEKTEDVFRDVAGLAQTRAGRIRTLVKDVHTLHARRTVMVSKEDTSIDGRKILLG
jgi:hypothetical protein